MHKKAKRDTKEKQQKAKAYADIKRRAKDTDIVIGDDVLVKQVKRNKYTPGFDPKPLTVVGVNGTMVTAKLNDYIITRNILHFKKFWKKKSTKRNICMNYDRESEDDETDTEIPTSTAEQQHDVDVRPRKYPRRNRRRPHYSSFATT